MMLIIIMLIFASTSVYASDLGIGYITKTETPVYTNSEDSPTDEVLPSGFPLLSWDATSVLYGKSASESISDGRLHVRYWKNGKNSEGGENTGWVEPASVKRFAFGCCGEAMCSGIKARPFKARTYSDCFNIAFDDLLERFAAGKKTTTSGTE